MILRSGERAALMAFCWMDDEKRGKSSWMDSFLYPIVQNV